MTELKQNTKLEFKGLNFQVKYLGVDEEIDPCYILEPLSPEIQDKLPEHARHKLMVITKKTFDMLKEKGYVNIISEPLGGTQNEDK